LSVYEWLVTQNEDTATTWSCQYKTVCGCFSLLLLEGVTNHENNGWDKEGACACGIIITNKLSLRFSKRGVGCLHKPYRARNPPRGTFCSILQILEISRVVPVKIKKFPK
jgi:hypothetical protein